MREIARLALVALALAAPVARAAADETSVAPDAGFYSSSLHYTARGLEYWYAKERGGLERITGVPASELGCLDAKCHVRSCDVCHRKDVGGKAAYSLRRAREQEACRACHPVDAKDAALDVHMRRGMTCMDCHSAREIHGDGVAYDSCMQPGAMDTRCEKCHARVGGFASHTVHGGKVDCAACHVRESVACLNCHVGARLEKGEHASIRLEGMLFLVNHDGKVTVADFLTHVYGRKTMVTLAPWFPHLVVKEGRRCEDCHGTETARSVADGRFVPVRWEDGGIRSARGVIPVVEGMKWNLVFLDRVEGKWVPLRDAEEPLVQFAGFCTPLTREQLAKLEAPPRPAPGPE